MFHNSTTCKKCNSDQTQSFQMVYETGTSSGQMNFLTCDGDSIGIGGGNVSNQTVLARKVKPPIKPEWTFIEILLVTAIPVVIFLFYSLIDSIIVILFLVFGSGIGAFMAVENSYKKRRPVYQLQMARWMRSWICLKCGAMWELKK